MHICMRSQVYEKKKVRIFFFLKEKKIFSQGFPDGTSGKEPACPCRRLKKHELSLSVREDPLEDGMATHSSIRA